MPSQEFTQICDDPHHFTTFCLPGNFLRERKCTKTCLWYSIERRDFNEALLLAHRLIDAAISVYNFGEGRAVIVKPAKELGEPLNVFMVAAFCRDPAVLASPEAVEEWKEKVERVASTEIRET